MPPQSPYGNGAWNAFAAMLGNDPSALGRLRALSSERSAQADNNTLPPGYVLDQNGAWNERRATGAEVTNWPGASGAVDTSKPAMFTMAELYGLGLRPHHAPETFDALERLVDGVPTAAGATAADAPQAFTLADVEAERRKLGEIAAGQGLDAVAAAIAHGKLGDFMTAASAPPRFDDDMFAPPRPTDPWGYLVPPRGPLPTWETAPPAAPAPTQPLRFDDRFPPSATIAPRSIDPSPYRVPPPYAPQATWPDTVPQAVPSQGSSFDERFGGLPGPQQTNHSDLLPVRPHPMTAVPQDPFEAAAARTANAVMPLGGRQEGTFTRVLESIPPYFPRLAERAFESSAIHRRTGEYDPAPIVEATLLAAGIPRVPAGALGSGIGKGIGGASTNLPMDEASRMGRAQQIGHHTHIPLGHGTATSFTAFDLSKAGSLTGAAPARVGIWTEVDPRPGGAADQFARMAAERTGGNPQIYPLLHRAERPGAIELTGNETTLQIADTIADAWERGYDSIMLRNYRMSDGRTTTLLAVKDPAQLRSKFAVFDPAKKDSPNLLASIPALLGGLLGGSAPTRPQGD